MCKATVILPPGAGSPFRSQAKTQWELNLAAWLFMPKLLGESKPQPQGVVEREDSILLLEETNILERKIFWLRENRDRPFHGICQHGMFYLYGLKFFFERIFFSWRAVAQEAWGRWHPGHLPGPARETSSLESWRRSPRTQLLVVDFFSVRGKSGLVSDLLAPPVVLRIGLCLSALQEEGGRLEMTARLPTGSSWARRTSLCCLSSLAFYFSDI